MSCGCLASIGITIIIKLLPELKWGFVAFSRGQYHRICSISILDLSLKITNYIPLHNKVVGGYVGFTPPVRLSIRPSIRPSTPHPMSAFVAPTVLAGCISYLYILSSNFRRCVTCKVILKFEFWQFFKNFNFNFVLFWLGIWCESLVWVIMGGGGGGGFTELRRSSLRLQQQLPVASELRGNCHGDKTRCSYEQVPSLPLIIALVHVYACDFCP